MSRVPKHTIKKLSKSTLTAVASSELQKEIDNELVDKSTPEVAMSQLIDDNQTQHDAESGLKRALEDDDVITSSTGANLCDVHDVMSGKAEITTSNSENEGKEDFAASTDKAGMTVSEAGFNTCETSETDEDESCKEDKSYKEEDA